MTSRLMDSAKRLEITHYVYELVTYMCATMV